MIRLFHTKYACKHEQETMIINEVFNQKRCYAQMYHQCIQPAAEHQATVEIAKSLKKKNLDVNGPTEYCKKKNADQNSGQSGPFDPQMVQHHLATMTHPSGFRKPDPDAPGEPRKLLDFWWF